jgi:hypothetical protein
MSGSYAELYRRARAALEQEAELRLGRPLTRRESNLFRNCGTLTMLESLGMKVYLAHNAEELAANLAASSMTTRFNLAVDELIRRLEQFLRRPLNQAEQQQLRRVENVEALWELEHMLHSVPPGQVEVTLAQQLARQRTLP